jgi:hypothetical protein
MQPDWPAIHNLLLLPPKYGDYRRDLLHPVWDDLNLTLKKLGTTQYRIIVGLVHRLQNYLYCKEVEETKVKYTHSRDTWRNPFRY